MNISKSMWGNSAEFPHVDFSRSTSRASDEDVFKIDAEPDGFGSDDSRAYRKSGRDPSGYSIETREIYMDTLLTLLGLALDLLGEDGLDSGSASELFGSGSALLEGQGSVAQ